MNSDTEDKTSVALPDLLLSCKCNLIIQFTFLSLNGNKLGVAAGNCKSKFVFDFFRKSAFKKGRCQPLYALKNCDMNTKKSATEGKPSNEEGKKIKSE